MQTFFNDLTNLLRDKYVHLTNFKFSAMLVIFGIEHNIITDGVMDLVVLLAKAYIYRSKTIRNVPTLSSFKTILYSRYLIVKNTHATNNQDNEFMKRWSCYKDFQFLM